MNPPEKALCAVVENFVLGCFEPEPIKFTQAHEKIVPRVRAAIQSAGEEPSRFDVPVNRNGFLCGCLDYTEAENIEHLIVGYGYRHGSTSKIHSVHHERGNVGTVTIPPNVLRTMRRHHDQSNNAEVIVFHNHPVNPLNLLLDNLPLTSGADRRALENLALAPHQVGRSLSGGGRILCYLGENGFVKQFRLPAIQSMLGRARETGYSLGIWF